VGGRGLDRKAFGQADIDDSGPTPPTHRRNHLQNAGINEESMKTSHNRNIAKLLWFRFGKRCGAGINEESMKNRCRTSHNCNNSYILWFQLESPLE
jgi:hypothetical protein